uniref:Uncharacterized protein n=1 Tax=Knipowitschia caucasica TaxID=637954 RepID=A0AAV2K440_KNICA
MPPGVFPKRQVQDCMMGVRGGQLVDRKLWIKSEQRTTAARDGEHRDINYSALSVQDNLLLQQDYQLRRHFLSDTVMVE